MFFFFGWGNKKPKDLGRVVPANCSHCNNLAFLKLLQSQEYVSFFFIPISSSPKYFLSCEICSSGIELKDKYLPKVKRLMAVTADWSAKAMSKERYEGIVKEEDLIGEINRETNHPGITKICPKCGKGYDRNWKVCLHCSVLLQDKGAVIASV